MPEYTTIVNMLNEFGKCKIEKKNAKRMAKYTSRDWKKLKNKIQVKNKGISGDNWTKNHEV